MQQLTIAGNVGKTPELRNTPNGDSVLGFSLAVDNGKDASGNKRDATWYDCSIWGKRATALQHHITKGTKLVLTGRPSARAHDGKAYLQISVDNLTFMGGGEERGNGDAGGYQSGGQGGGSAGGAPAGGQYDDMSDSIPFAPCII